MVSTTTGLTDAYPDGFEQTNRSDTIRCFVSPIEQVTNKPLDMYKEIFIKDEADY